MCVSGHISGDSVMFDFAPFESAGTPSCSCTIYIVAGSRLEFNYVYSPGYYGCGSTITIRHQTTSTIRCLQGAESLTVTPGDSVTVQITRERDAFDSKYWWFWPHKTENAQMSWKLLESNGVKDMIHRIWFWPTPPNPMKYKEMIKNW